MDDFATELDLSTFVGRDIPQPRAAMLIGQASGLIRSYCKWHIAPVVSELLTVDGSGIGLLQLPTLHVVSIESLTEEGVACTDYEWSANGSLFRLHDWSHKSRSIVVDLTHGYEEAPLEIQSVCLQLAARLLANPLGVKSEAAGGVSVTYASGVLGDYEKAALDPYRIGGAA